MTLRDMLDSGIQIEGCLKVQTWEHVDYPNIHCEGHDVTIPEECLDKEITYIFPYSTAQGSAICIELAYEDDE